jgi:hypothetical protein
MGRIPAGQATSLLLDAVELSSLPANYEYAIWAETEFLGEEDIRSYAIGMTADARRMLLSEYVIRVTPANRQFLSQGETVWFSPPRMEDVVYGRDPLRLPQDTTNFIAELIDELGNVVGVPDDITLIPTIGIQKSMTNEYGTRLRTIQSPNETLPRSTQHFALTIGNNQPGGEYRLRIRETTTNTSTYIRLTINQPAVLTPNLPSTNNLTWLVGNPWEAHSIFQDPDNPYLQWRVLVSDDGAGNALIITEHLQSNPFTWNDGGTWTPFEFSNAHSEMIAWWDNSSSTVGPGAFIRSLALNYGYQTDLRAPVVANHEIQAGIEVNATAITNEIQAVTRPRYAPGMRFTELQRQVVPAFILSMTEINLYFENAEHLGHTRSFVDGQQQEQRAMRPAVWIRLNH